MMLSALSVTTFFNDQFGVYWFIDMITLRLKVKPVDKNKQV